MSYGNTDKDGQGLYLPLLVDTEARLIVGLPFERKLESEETNDDSNKDLPVDAGEEWVVESLVVEYVSDGTGGDRQLVVELQDDSGNVLAKIAAGAVQAASLTRFYTFAPGLPLATAFADDTILAPLPEVLLKPSYVIHVQDQAAVSAAGDDMHVYAYVRYRTEAS